MRGWTSEASEIELKAAVDRLVDVAPGPRDLVAHGLEFFAARRWRELGREVPLELAAAELRHAFVQHSARAVLSVCASAGAAPVLLVKGPAAAHLYDDPATRPYHDLDLVARDPERLQAALLAQGYVEIGDVPPSGHHSSPLLVPGVPLVLEIHGRPKWLRGLEPPSFDRLIRSAEPFDGIDGVLALPSAEHAALLAVHVWAHDPLTRLLRLIDVAVASRASDEEALREVIREWRLERLWRATDRALGSVLFGMSPSAPIRIWGRNLRAAREATVWESYLARLLGPFFVLPPVIASRASIAELAWLLRPEPGESFATRRRRIARHLRQLGTRRTEARRTDAGE